MVVDGKMYDPNTQTIKAEGYVDLNQIPDQNEGDKYEGDTAACTSWTTAGNCVYGTDANNAQLNEINKTHAGPEFEEVDVPVESEIKWRHQVVSTGTSASDITKINYAFSVAVSQVAGMDYTGKQFANYRNVELVMVVNGEETERYTPDNFDGKA